MFKDRVKSYKKLQELRNSHVIVYVTGDRAGMECEIAQDVLPLFADHLDAIGDVDKISLVLYSNGGQLLAGWSLVNLIRSFCKDFEVIVPFRCQSTATLIALGANRIVMTKQATLGPIDPSTNGLLNPKVIAQGQEVSVPVSVEHVNAFLDMVKTDFGISDQSSMANICIKLAESIHPLALGAVQKSRTQIKMLAERMLKYHEIDKEHVDKVVSFLCSESGSHDYTIYRREASEELGLNIEKPDDELYSVIKDIYKDIEAELELRERFNPNVMLSMASSTSYNCRRALIESIGGNTDVFISKGSLKKENNQIQITLTSEGWAKDKV